MNVFRQRENQECSQVFICHFVQLFAVQHRARYTLSVARSLTLIVLAAALVASAAPTARADCDDETCTRELWGFLVEITAPKNWRPAEERSYPSILVWMGRRDPPGRMLLSAERLDVELDAKGYAERSRALLEVLGFKTREPQLHPQTGAYWFDFDNGGVYLRQAFLVVGGVGYALTLSATSRRLRGQHLRAFDFTLRTLRVRRLQPLDEDEDEPENDDAEPEPATE